MDKLIRHTKQRKFEKNKKGKPKKAKEVHITVKSRETK